MPGRQRARRASAVALVGLLLVPLGARRAGAFTCEATDGGGCPLPGTTCWAACEEADVRALLALVNGCPAYPPGQEVTLAMGPDATTPCGATPIPMAMAPTFPAVADGACGDENANRYNALCLAGTGLVFDGRGAVFTYAGDQACASCDGECTICPPGGCSNRQPALFVLRGARNTVRDLEMRFFPEGIQLRDGDGHVVTGVTSGFICEDAITVNSGSGHRIAHNTLVGNTDPADGGGACFQRVEGSTCDDDGDCPANARCYCGELSKLGNCATPPGPPIWPADTPGQCYRPTRCGLDKAVQVNGGESVIEHNRIDLIGQPVHVDAGTHTIADNLTCGSRTNLNSCQAYDVSGGLVTFARNRIDHCKFGIRVTNAGRADAVDNVLTNGWISAFQVRGVGGGRLRAAGNLLRRHGFATTSDCQRGALVVVGDPAARVDFGGGDGLRRPVLDDGGVSPGRNVFCQDPAGGPLLAHVWNVTDCACATNPSCSCSMATNAACGTLCPFAAPCCALEADGACFGSVGAGASIGLGAPNEAANAFVPLPTFFPNTPTVVDRVPVETRIANVTGYGPCHAIVVPECECLGQPDGAACNDGDACTPLDVCQDGVCVGLQRATCAPQGQCRAAGVCDALTGECSDPPAPDGTPCEDGEACTAGDACVAGTCTSGGPGPDGDGDGFCDAIDICPGAEDPPQRDLDGDDVGDACDSVDAPLDLVRAVVRRRGRTATVSLRGTFVLHGGGDAFGAGRGIALTVRSGAAVEHRHAWDAAECRTSREGRIACRAKGARVRFDPIGGVAYRFRAALGRVPLEGEPDAALGVGVVVTHDYGVDRVGMIVGEACRRRSAKLTCRQRQVTPRP